MKPEELLIHTEFIRNLVRHLVRDEHLQYDVVQNTLLKAMTHPPAQGNLRGWLARVAQNFALKIHREDTRRLKREKTAAKPEELVPTQEVVEQEEIRSLVVKIVLELKEPYRTALLLRYYKGHPPREAAKKLNMPVETVRSHIKRGLSQVRDKLDTQYGGDRSKWLAMVGPILGMQLSSPAATGSLLSGAIVMSVKTKLFIAASLLLGILMPIILLMDEGEPHRTDLIGANPNGVETVIGEATKNQRIKDKRIDPSDKKVHLSPSVQKLTIKGRAAHRKNGKAIKNAHVRINLLPHKKENPPIELITDSSGAFNHALNIPESLEVSAFHITLSAKGCMDYTTSFPKLKDTASLDCGLFLMDESKSHVIKIRDEFNRPVPNAKLDFYKGNVGLAMSKLSNANGEVRLTSQELKREFRQCYFFLRVQAQGMSDHFIKQFTESNLPKVIVLKPKETLTLRVVDSKTNIGIPGAKVKAPIRYFSEAPELLDLFSGETDAAGNIEFPKMCGLNNVSTQLMVLAKGYLKKKWYLFPEDYPKPIVVEPICDYVKTRFVDKTTLKPLPNIPVSIDASPNPLFKIKRYWEFNTDENGFYDLPLTENFSTEFGVNTPGHLIFYGSYDKNEGMQNLSKHPVSISVVEDHFQVGLIPTIDAAIKLRVNVFNELGEPLPGAMARVDHHLRDAIRPIETYANTYGEAQFKDFQYPPGAKLHLDVMCDGYAPFHTTFVFNPTEDWITKEVVLKEGIRFEKFRVMDKNGANLKAWVEVKLFNEDGNTVMLYKKSDANGCCAFDLPFFTRGEVCAASRSRYLPKTGQRFTFDQVLKQEEIIVIAHDMLAKSSYIQGVVQDEKGRPMARVTIKPQLQNIQLTEANASPIRSVATNKDGFFKVEVIKGQLYNLSVSKMKGLDYWRAEDLTLIPDGSDLKITMIKQARVEADLSNHKGTKKGKSLLSFFSANITLVLLSEQNEEIESKWSTFKNQSKIFVGVPPGRMRLAIKTPQGYTPISKFFDVQQGKHVRIKAKMN